MIKRFIVFSILLGFVFMTGSAFAVPAGHVATLSTPGTERTLTLPVAADNSPVISLGTAVDPASGGLVEGYAIVHYAKPDGAGNGKGGGGKGGSTCYGFLAKNAKWKNVEPWVVNPSNASGLENSFVFNNLASDITKWEDAASFDILGNGFLTNDVLMADTSSPDNVNEAYFADVSTPGAIAVTIVWGYFGGRPSARELVEWDMIFDDVDYGWSASGETGMMDFENIATHELGHSVGLADLYDSACSTETMYGYAGFGETNKRTLEAGDIEGILKLY